MLPSERWQFVHTHRTCVLGYTRKKDGPAQSVFSYVPTDNGDLLVVTMGARAKAKAVDRLGKVSILVLDEKWPMGYLQMYCNPLDEDARPLVAAMAKEEGRVVLRCTPYETFATPPRHLHSNDQDEKVTHWLSGSVPWDATDPK